ncbi:hypothetical protein FACS1894184_11690 [Clostridia bacterium]|nr:hypothetical protein FACS1894184_11690 [Clostridia bacterium]
MKLEYRNARGKTIVFAAPDGWKDTPYLITGVSGAHGLDSEIASVEQFPRDGEVFIGARVEPRTITLDGMIHDHEGRNQTAKYRVPLLETMIPKELGTLTASRGSFKRKIGCIVERAPFFATATGKKFSVTLRCPDPYWTDADGAASVELNGWIGLFEFALAIPDASDGTDTDDPEDIDGIEFGTRGNTSIASVYNAGQITTGFTATITAGGTVVNPSLMNITTQDTIKFRLTMLSGDTIKVSTSEYDKWARWYHQDGTDENAMKYIDPAFVFFALEPGGNICRASADTGGELLNVVFEYALRYLGL